MIRLNSPKEWLSSTGLLVVSNGYWQLMHLAQEGTEHPLAAIGTTEDALGRYRGFDGRAWPNRRAVEEMGITLTDGLAPLDEYGSVSAYYAFVVPNYPHCSLLALTMPDGAIPHGLLPATFSFVGYDYGFYIAEYNLFSSLYNEVIFGHHDELRRYAGELNDYLLAPSLDMVERVDRSRQQLVATGANLEGGGPEAFGPIAIYASL
jgi:hypothetical protein